MTFTGLLKVTQLQDWFFAPMIKQGVASRLNSLANVDQGSIFLMPEVEKIMWIGTGLFYSHNMHI
jgi:hypothetical protein